jgi:hypothetical protein
MQLLRRHKYILLSLGIYWPALFVLTHIPVPQIAEQSGMSDKMMHVLAYLALVFFVWLAISPYEKVKWNRPKVWIVLAVAVCYGAFDEWLQARVGRQMEFLDLVGDIKGALIALGILTFLSFWPAIIVVSSIFIFSISNYSALLAQYSEYYLDTAFHLTAYTTLTLLWIQHLDRRPEYQRDHPCWPLAALALPFGLLAAVKLAGFYYYHKSIWWVDVATAVFGIAAAILVSWLVFRLGKKDVPFTYR